MQCPGQRAGFGAWEGGRLGVAGRQRNQYAVVAVQGRPRLRHAVGRGAVRRPEELDPESVSGRGLSLVDALASAWSAEHSTDGTTVWFELALTSVARYAFDVGDWEQSGWIVPLGASGHPGSRHYADQATDWAAVRLRPMRYDWARIAADAETHQHLLPAAGR